MYLPGEALVLHLPYSEYWLPLLIGMGAGVLSLAVGKLVFGKRSVVAPHPGKDRDQQQEFDPFVHGSPTEQRKTFRRSGNTVAIYYAHGNKDKPKVGWVYDRSSGGLGLVLNEPWDESKLLSVRVVDCPVTTPWVDLEVRNCRKVDDGFEVGCKFVRTPPWSVLLLFG